MRSYPIGKEPKDERYVVVPGFVKIYMQETEDPELKISEVEPVPESAYTEIEQLIRKIEYKGHIEFFK